MSKKNKNFNKDFGNEAPEVYNMDDIGYMSDEAIHDRGNRLENERNRLVSMGKDPYFWEVELAYLRREQQLRQTRADRHVEFVQTFGKMNLENEDFEKAAEVIDPAAELN